MNNSVIDNNLIIELPDDVDFIISTLCSAGFEAYAVGGCVRDSLLGRVPDDWDITTSAKPEQVKALFKRTIDTGIKHGTVTIMIDRNGYEVTTYRIDGEYEDGRHPNSIEFATELIEDLKRRDFTINAMAYNRSCGLIDEFDGINDLQKGIIRCVGDATQRFTEDALRMMRAIRFSAQLGFSIEASTYEGICKLAGNIIKVSKERIHVELNKTLMSNNPDYVELLCKTGLTKEILPIIDRILSDKRHPIIMQRLKENDKVLVLRYAALFSETDYKEAEQTLHSLKLDNYTINTVTHLVRCWKKNYEESEPAIREAIHNEGRDIFPLILQFQASNISAKEKTTGINMSAPKNHNQIIRKMFADIIARGDAISIKDLDINGQDLMEYGFTGPRIGQTLNELLKVVMENPKLNEKETLIALIEHEG